MGQVACTDSPSDDTESIHMPVCNSWEGNILLQGGICLQLLGSVIVAD